MKDAIEPSKIVNLSQRPESPERLGALVHAVRDTASRRLQGLLGNMFEHVDDALFDLAEKAENNAAQMHYFDGMREVRKRRPVVERAYLAQFSRDLTEFAANRRSAATETAASSLGNIELSLVGESELEESLAITSMISKNASRITRDLFALNQRLAVICGGIEVDDTNNPVGPSALTQAFRQAMRELSADMRVKLIIYKLFDRYVLSGLEELYQELNTELMRAGVLPQLRHGITRNSASQAVAGAAARAASGSEVTAEEAGNLLDTLHALFSARRAGHDLSAIGAPVAGNRALPTANELLGALSVLQSQMASQVLAGASSTGGVTAGGAGSMVDFDIAHEVAALKEHLLNQLGSLRGERPHQVSSIDEDTIDLVGMLFEFILEDRNLPPQMQVLLARLQIPYLKAAILDRRLFAHRQHPARRLLDSLAEAAKGWSDESDKDRRLYDKVKSIVELLLHEFDDDMGIFDRLLVDLHEFQELSRKRAELAEQRVAESTRGREKLELARRRAAREILERIDGRPIPPLVHGVLARAWANYLVLILLRQGEDSPEFADGLRFVNEFVASTRLGSDAESRATLRQMLPGIERALRRGLANVAFQEHDVERLLDQLHAYYRQQLGEEPTPATVTEQVPPAIPESIQSIVDATQEAAPLAADEADEPLEILPPEVLEQMDAVHAMKPGTWIEFCPAGAAPERAKLSWISPMSGRYLFVNRRGLKVGDFAPQELAASLAGRSARILASNAFFDRAMDAIVGRLSQPATDAPEPG